MSGGLALVRSASTSGAERYSLTRQHRANGANDNQGTDRAPNEICSPRPQLTMRLGVILNISGEKPGPSSVPRASRT